MCEYCEQKTLFPAEFVYLSFQPLAFLFFPSSGDAPVPLLRTGKKETLGTRSGVHALTYDK